jgi:hypothetical protein
MKPRIELSDELRRLVSDPALLPSRVLLNGRQYTVERPVKTGFKGVIWKVIDELGLSWALKLCIREDYDDRSYLQEVSRAAKLRPYARFAQIADAGVVETVLGDAVRQTFVAFVEEWVEGVTLDQFLHENQAETTASFFVAYVEHACEVLAALETVGLRHDDLHARNVMICPPPAGSLSRGWIVKVVDTGSLKPVEQAVNKPKDDHRHVVDHFVDIWNVIHTQRPAAARDRRFLTATKYLIASMVDDDLAIALREPAQIRREFLLAYTRANVTRADDSMALSSPFEFISAEHIANDRLLVSLFATTCPWLSKVSGPDPCLVTGPRGCGKSTIFRWLSLKAHLHKPFAEIEAHTITGFYISCSIDLQNRLSWIKTRALAERFRAEIVHYFNLLLAREILSTLSLISQREDGNATFGLGQVQQTVLHQFIMNSLGPSLAPRLQGASRLAQAREAVEREMFATHAQILKGLNRPQVTADSFLGELTEILCSQLPLFKKKRIAFLVDDFSVHRLPGPVQIVLNRIIWERRPSHVFKLSCEKYGAELTDSFQATADVTREMKEVDCGREYVALDDTAQTRKALRFAEELLDNRLRAAGYNGTARGLIGDSKWKHKSLARALTSAEQGRIEGQYHGLQTISHLCSGDVSSLLLVYDRIFETGNVSRTSTACVDKIKQDRAIREVSRRLLEAIKPCVPSGTEMYNIVSAFGQLVRNVLQHGKPQEKGKSKRLVPTQIPRMEIDQIGGGVVDALNESQRGIARELVRRAIFIEMEPGLSRHGNVTTLRWHLRRIYLPAFGAALAKNDAVKRNPDWFKYFLTDPRGACAQEWDRWPKSSGIHRSLPLLD